MLYALARYAALAAVPEFAERGNPRWAQQGGALVLFISKKTMDDGRPSVAETG